jgi:amidase
MAALARGNLQGRRHAGRYDAGLADFFGAERLKQPVTQALTVKSLISVGEYLHERYHGRLYAKAQNLRAGLRAKYDASLQRFDALVMPSTPMKAHRRGDHAPFTMVTNTAPFDVTGHPGLSVPCGMAEGLPIGLLLIGGHFDDVTLLPGSFLTYGVGKRREKMAISPRRRPIRGIRPIRSGRGDVFRRLLWLGWRSAVGILADRPGPHG